MADPKRWELRKDVNWDELTPGDVFYIGDIAYRLYSKKKHGETGESRSISKVGLPKLHGGIEFFQKLLYG